MKRFIKISLFVLAVPVLLVFIAIIYYQFDETLSPGVLQTINHEQKLIPPQENAYYYLLGMFVSKSSVPYIKAEAIVKSAKHGYLNGDDNIVFIQEKYPSAFMLKPNKNSIGLCRSVQDDCLEYVKQHSKIVKNVVSENEVLLRRLREAYLIKSYQETPYINVLGFGYLPRVHDIAMADISLEWDLGRSKTALDELQKDYDFWRMVLGSDSSLITHMIAGGLVYRDLTMFSRMLSKCEKCVDNNINIEAFLRPFQKQDLSLRKAMGFDYRHVYKNMIDSLSKKGRRPITGDIIEPLFSKENATFNQMYAMYQQYIKISECPTRNLQQCYCKAEKWKKKGFDVFSWGFWKNPIGAVLVAIARPAFDGYAQNSHQIELMRRLLLIKYKLLKNKVKQKNIQKYINRLPAEIKNQVKGVPIKWFKAKQAIGFQFTRGINTSVMVKL